MAWRIEGTYFESCSCDLICPCIAGFALPADGDRCEFTFAMRIERGEIDGPDVGGLNLAFVGDAPPLMESWRHRLRVGDRVELEIEDAEAAGGGIRRLTGPGHFMSSSLAVARATSSRVRAFGLDFETRHKNAHSAPFSWSG